MSGNLEAQYLAVRGQDPEEAAYQQSLAKAREEDSHEGILASLGHTVGEAASSLRDPERTGKNALVALFDMVKNTAQMGADVWGAATNLDNKRTAKDMGVQGEVKPVPEIRLEDLAPDFMQKANALRDEAAFGSTGGDVFTQKSLQFAIPFMGSMKLLGAGAEVGAMANLGKAVVADAAVSFSVWDPHEGRFADLLNTVYPNAAVIGPAIDFLASDPNDSAMEGRFKNALDSQLAGAAFSSFAFVAGKTLRAAKSGELFKPGPPAGSPGAQRGFINPSDVLGLNTKLELPSSPEFSAAVENTPGAKITEDGLHIKLIRFQKPELEGEQAIRTGVFYLPQESKNARHYKHQGTVQDNYYGGPQKQEGETLIRRPLFVKGATGGKAPESAYDAIKGKGASQKLADDVFHAIAARSVTQKDPELFRQVIRDFLHEHGGDGSMAPEIIRVSKAGNTLRYALQEHVIAHAVRDAGYDAVVGYSKGKAGPFISEVFDVREQTYPSSVINPQIHDAFTGAN